MAAPQRRSRRRSSCSRGAITRRIRRDQQKAWPSNLTRRAFGVRRGQGTGRLGAHGSVQRHGAVAPEQTRSEAAMCALAMSSIPACTTRAAERPGIRRPRRARIARPSGGSATQNSCPRGTERHPAATQSDLRCTREAPSESRRVTRLQVGCAEGRGASGLAVFGSAPGQQQRRSHEADSAADRGHLRRGTADLPSTRPPKLAASPHRRSRPSPVDIVHS